jgi:hypothetical protein
VRLEILPVIVGALVALVGLALVADGWITDAPARVAERRRHARAERHRGGEIAIGVGLVCAGAALVGRDGWRYGTVAVLVAAALVTAGAVLNVRFLAERLANRGALRRGREGERRQVGHAAAPGDPARRPHDRRLGDRRGEPAASAGPATPPGGPPAA